MDTTLNRKVLLSEFLGTFALVFIAMGVRGSNQLSGGACGIIGVALAEGFILAVMVSLTTVHSGGHLNPAVTLGALVGKRVGVKRALAYMFSQCLGAAVAAFVITMVLPAEILDPVGMGIPTLNPKISVSQGFIMEVVLTFFLVFVFFSAPNSENMSNKTEIVRGLLMGLTFTAGILVGAQITGAAMNPVIYAGPALLAGNLNLAWLYWLAPSVGGILAGYIYTHFLEESN